MLSSASGSKADAIITTSYMAHEPTSTVRARRLRERRARGVVMVAPVEVGVLLLLVRIASDIL